MDKKLLFTIIDQLADSRKDRVAVVGAGRSLTYGDLTLFSDHIARQLISSGLRKGQVVGVYLPGSIEYVLTILGINKAGGIFMPLEMSHPPERTGKLLEHVQPAYVIIEHGSGEGLSAFVSLLPDTILLSCHAGAVLTALDESAALPVVPGIAFPDLTGDDSCYLIYTSGSTGTPKIIEGVHKSLSHFIHWEVGEFNLTDTVNVGLVAPISFDVSLRDIFVPLLAGGTLFIPEFAERREMRQFLSWIDRSCLTLLHIVPSLFRLLMDALEQADKRGGHASSLKYILLAGEPLYGRDVLRWRAVSGDLTELVNLYGPSETTLAKLFYRIPASGIDSDSMMPLGSPLPNTAIAITNNGRLCNIGDIGEIHIKTPFCSKGYYRDTALTTASFIQNPLHNDFRDIVYKTGDWGKYLPGKIIAFAGRQDGQVKIRGNRVEIPEVESHVLSYPGIQQAVIQPVESKDNSISLCCYFTGNGRAAVTDLREYVRKTLPDYMVPAYFVWLESFPLNLNGKINIRALPKPEEMLYEELEYQPPANLLEETIALIWSESLALKKVGVTNTFYELGGHSLIATRIVSKIASTLNKELSLKEFFENATVRQLAACLATKDETELESIPLIGAANRELA